ncbi:MAG: DNA-binding protein, partial [Luteibacter sp.]
MTLDNLVAIGRLAYLSPDITAIARLMRAAERNLAETAHPGISADTKFDIAYKSIMQCALAALASSGFRPSKSQPGHHQTAI